MDFTTINTPSDLIEANHDVELDEIIDDILGEDEVEEEESIVERVIQLTFQESTPSEGLEILTRIVRGMESFHEEVRNNKVEQNEDMDCILAWEKDRVRFESILKILEDIQL